MSQNAKKAPKQEISTARRGFAHRIDDAAISNTGAVLRHAGFRNSTLVLRWTEIAGENIARIAKPVKLQEQQDGAVLTLRCHPGAALLLQHQTRPLIEKLNAFAGIHVTRIRLIHGTVAAEAGIASHPAHRQENPGQNPLADAPTDLAAALKRLGETRKRRS